MLQVTAVRLLAQDVLGLSLSDPTGAALPAWMPGAHIDLRLPSGQVRSYSLCGDPGHATYEIAAALEHSGRGGSREIHRDQLVGRTLAVSGPTNDFALGDAPDYLFIAAGIGITPILPMVRSLLPADRPWRLIYLGRSRRRMAFLDELAELSRTHPGRCEVVVGDEGPQLDLGRLLAAASPGSAVYCCGPPRLLDEAERLHALHPGAFALRVERFGRPAFDAADDDRSDAAALPTRGAADEVAHDGTEVPCDPDGSFEVELRKTGLSIKVAAGETILGNARKVRTGLTFSCSSGYCGTCETRVVQGVPDHRDDVLSDEEKATNRTMMICVGRSRTKRLVLEL